MSWYAVRALDDAYTETRALLLPFDPGVWVRLAFVGLFAGIPSGGSPSAALDVGNVGEVAGSAGYGAWTANGGWRFALDEAVVLAVASVVVVGVLFALVASVMEFVLVDAVRSQSVAIRSPFRRRFVAGVRLFGFRAFVALGVVLAVGGVAMPVYLAVTGGNPWWLLALAVTAPLLFAAVVVAAVVLEFTTAFVVPLMADGGHGVLAGWRRLWPTLRAEWTQFAGFVAVKAVLLFGAGVVLGVALTALLVPVGILVGVLAFAGALAAPAVTALLAAAIAALVVYALVNVPVVTALRYHSLATLDQSPVEFTLR